MRSNMIFVAVVSVFAVVSCPVLAQGGSVGTVGSPIEISDWGQENPNGLDQDSWKGWTFVFVKNTSLEPWGNFHFEIISYDGSDISNVDFRDASMGGMDPISTQTPLTWTIDNDVVGAEMNLYFFSDPVMPGEHAQFQVWTDNTTDKVNFGICMWPSPVPEPSSLLVLSGSLVGMAGLAWRRRK